MEDIKILVIDDEKNILESIKMVLTYEYYKVETASSGLDGIDLFINHGRLGQNDRGSYDTLTPGAGKHHSASFHDTYPFIALSTIFSYSNRASRASGALYLPAWSNSAIRPSSSLNLSFSPFSARSKNTSSYLSSPYLDFS